jgi:hypothetical protein
MAETLQNIAAWAFQNLLWNIVMAAVGAIAATAVVKKGLGYLKSQQNLFWFAGGTFALILAISFLATQRIQIYPRLQGTIEAAYVTQSVPRALVIIETVVNSGTMPSSAYVWRVSLKHGTQTIDCLTTGLPEQFTLMIPARGSVPQRTVNYYGRDSIAVKALSPISVGSVLTGILACELKDIDVDKLTEGDEVTVSFSDVLQNTHTASIQGSSQFVDVKMFPGIAQEIK